MNKIWYIFIDDKQEGPFSERDLLFDSRVNLETLVWKEGYESWVPLRHVRELRKLFEERQPQEEIQKPDEESKTFSGKDEIVLAYGRDPNFLFLILLLILVLSLYIIYHIF